MLAYLAIIAVTILLMLGVSILDGDFDEGGLFATLGAWLSRWRHEGAGLPPAPTPRDGFSGAD